MRVGQGLDAHRLETGRRLVLGGVEIPFEAGLAAHSDGDVVIHALCDALLGAAALGDIGGHFGDDRADLAGIDSRILLRQVVAMIGAHGLFPGNVDVTVICQRPKLAAHIATMRERLAADLGLEPGRVNIKATTTEGLGFAGRGEGIAAQAVASLMESQDQAQ